MSNPNRPSMQHRKSTENLRGEGSGLTRERMELLTRIYHTSTYAREATGVSEDALNRAARRYGLSFRQTRYAEDE